MPRNIQDRAGLHRAEILDHRFLSPPYFTMALRIPEGFPPCRPGQFLHVRVTGGMVPLLRRPFSLLDVCDGRLHLLLKDVGRGTHLLARAEVGEALDILGPLGSGFPLPVPGTRSLMVGGGVGLAPLYFLASELARRGQGSEVELFFGASTQADLFPELLERLPWSVHLATLDGTRGFEGTCVDLFETLRARAGDDASTSALYACGPRGMLRALVRAQRERYPGFHVSMEETMGCGMGACRGCSLPAPDGSYLTTCTHGPVFREQELDWERIGSG